MTPNLQDRTNREDPHAKPAPWYTLLSPLIIVGFLMIFLGFIFPGWLWLSNTPGDVEMITLLAATVCGIIGIILTVTGFVFIGFERAKNKRTD